MRVNDWQSKLYNGIQARQTRTFAWGEHDCLLFAADMVFEMTGVDHATTLRGTYSDAAGAVAAIQQLTGCTDAAAVVDLYSRRVPVAFARRGDLVARIENGRSVIGVCAGGGCYFAGPLGLVCHTLSACVIAWRVC